MPVNSADQIRINTSLPIRVSLAISVLTVAFIALYYYATKDWKDTAVFAGASVAAAGGIMAAFYAARALAFQMQQQADATEAAKERASHDKKVAALQYASRWNDPQMLEARRICREMIEMDGKGVIDIETALQNGGDELRVVHMLNFLEEIAISVRHDVADADILRDIYGDAICAVWRCMGPWALQ